ncbi:hypothetical protein I4U23_011209 [Adineta vaga]|nr:hypothetical protein I4U23_011209 [Adineta vaga]
MDNSNQSQIELKQVITSDDKDKNNRQLLTGNDIQVQTERIKDVINMNTMIPNDSLIISDEEKTMDQHQNIVAMTYTKNPRIVEIVNDLVQSSTINVTGHFTADLNPLVGYADEPLLPLSKACAPLCHIFHNLLKSMNAH